MLTPDTAHGTNPATVTMAGYEVVKVATNERGGVDVDDLRAKADDEVACLMLTNPNTLGLFDENIAEIASIVHEVGGTLYYDGANLNAIMGHTRPGDMGFDIVHVNLHKTFSQPHGGGGPGSGPIAVSDRIAPYLPVPRIVRAESGNGAGPSFDLDYDAPTEVDRSPARVPGQLRRLRPLLRLHHQPRRRRPHARPPRPPCSMRTTCWRSCARAAPASTCRSPSSARRCTSSCSPARRPSASSGCETLDIAKRLLDYGFHPPTIYFPLLVDEALMVEPTETETRESLDLLAEAIEEILAEAESDPEILRDAPYTTPVRRLDEAAAAASRRSVSP